MILFKDFLKYLVTIFSILIIGVIFIVLNYK